MSWDLWQVEWAIAETSWGYYDDLGLGLTFVGEVTIPAGTRTTLDHLRQLAASIVDLGRSASLLPGDGADGESPYQRPQLVELSGAVNAVRLVALTGQTAKLGLAGTTDYVEVGGTFKAQLKTWAYGLFSPPDYTTHENRPYTNKRQSWSQVRSNRPLVIVHAIRRCRTISYRYVPGRYVRGEDSPDSTSAQEGTQGTFEEVWDVLSAGGSAYYHTSLDGFALPVTSAGVRVCAEMRDQASDLSSVLDAEAFAEFGRAAHNISIDVLEVAP